jgi:hypothetical protein
VSEQLVVISCALSTFFPMFFCSLADGFPEGSVWLLKKLLDARRALGEQQYPCELGGVPGLPGCHCDWDHFSPLLSTIMRLGSDF